PPPAPPRPRPPPRGDTAGDSTRTAGGSGRRRAVSRALRPRDRGFGRRPRREEHVVVEHVSAPRGPIDRLFLSRVRVASVAGDLRGRSRCAGGRPLQGSRGPRGAAARG